MKSSQLLTLIFYHNFYSLSSKMFLKRDIFRRAALRAKTALPCGFDGLKMCITFPTFSLSSFIIHKKYREYKTGR